MLLAGGRGAGAGAGRGPGRGAAGEGRAAGARASLARLLRLLRGLGDLPGAATLLLHVLDDAYGHRLPHVAHGKAACGEGVRARRSPPRPPARPLACLDAASGSARLGPLLGSRLR